MVAFICILCKLPKGSRVALPRIFMCTIQGYQNCKKLWWYAKTSFTQKSALHCRTNFVLMTSAYSQYLKHTSKQVFSTSWKLVQYSGLLYGDN